MQIGSLEEAGSVVGPLSHTLFVGAVVQKWLKASTLWDYFSLHQLPHWCSVFHIEKGCPSSEEGIGYDVCDPLLSIPHSSQPTPQSFLHFWPVYKQNCIDVELCLCYNVLAFCQHFTYIHVMSVSRRTSMSARPLLH